MSCQNSIFSFTNLLLNEGTNESDWISLIKDIENEDDTTAFVKNIQDDLPTNSNNELFYDIIDYIVDNSPESTVKLLSEDNFLDIFLNPLKNNVDVKIQMKIIYLIQKWSNKDKFPGFKNKLEFLKNNGISFPPNDFKMVTYEKYVKSQMNNQLNMENNAVNNTNELFSKNNNENNYSSDINNNNLFP